jgi:hypothetical protein
VLALEDKTLDFQDEIMAVHHCCNLTLSATSALKLLKIRTELQAWESCSIEIKRPIFQLSNNPLLIA